MSEKLRDILDELVDKLTPPVPKNMTTATEVSIYAQAVRSLEHRVAPLLRKAYDLGREEGSRREDQNGVTL